MKTPAAPAITSLTELVERLGRYAALSAQLETLAAEASAEVVAVKARLEAASAPLAAEMKAILLAAKPWWAANSEQLTDGKKKSVELAGCLIGERLSKPALGHPKPEHVALELLRGHGLAAMIRVKEEMDKLAISRLLAFEPEDPVDPQAVAELLELKATL
jgi:phage host-nuclease inhibitor protein Gam